MVWKPFIKNTGDAVEFTKEISEVEFRSTVIAMLSAINTQVCLLNMRAEEAFDTHITEVDI